MAVSADNNDASLTEDEIGNVFQHTTLQDELDNESYHSNFQALHRMNKLLFRGLPMLGKFNFMITEVQTS